MKRIDESTQTIVQNVDFENTEFSEKRNHENEICNKFQVEKDTKNSFSM